MPEAIMPSSNNFSIYAQGHLDGACFLYSTINAATALSNRWIKSWKKPLTKFPFRLDDFLSGAGTLAMDKEPEQLAMLCRVLLERMNYEIQVDPISPMLSPKALSQHLSEHKVVIVAIFEGRHWATLVDIDDKYFYLACSMQALNSAYPYEEKRSPKWDRIYNLKLTADELQLWDGPNFCLSTIC